LESVCTLTGTVGSNPTLSANYYVDKLVNSKYFFFNANI